MKHNVGRIILLVLFWWAIIAYIVLKGLFSIGLSKKDGNDNDKDKHR